MFIIIIIIRDFNNKYRPGPVVQVENLLTKAKGNILEHSLIYTHSGSNLSRA